MDEELRNLVSQNYPELPLSSKEQILRFHELLRIGNETQNLTRLISASDFYQGHLIDVCELLKTKWLTYPALDIGSGAGVPGLLSALIEKGEWVLSESEKRKAEFLQATVDALKIGTQVQVTSLRAEEYLRKKSINTLIARAVGPVDRIYSWIHHCSTWNKLILFKGPSWNDEWMRFQESKFKKDLVIDQTHSYVVGPEQKQRILISLKRTSV